MDTRYIFVSNLVYNLCYMYKHEDDNSGELLWCTMRLLHRMNIVQMRTNGINSVVRVKPTL